MAWGVVANTTIKSSKTAGTTLSWDLPNSTTATTGYVILAIAGDNVGTTDAESSEVSSVTDDAGNTYGKLAEFRNGNGSAGAGCIISVWGGKQTNSFGGTGTITFASSITARSAWIREFTIGSGNVVTVQTYATQAADAANFPSMNLSPPSAEYLWLRAIGWEEDSNAAGVITPTTNFTEAGPNGTTGGAANTNSCVYTEYRIFTGTTNASAPSWSGTQQDNANLYLALKEAAAGGSSVAPRAQAHYRRRRA